MKRENDKNTKITRSREDIPTNTPENGETREQDGKWKKGKSGNMKGRPVLPEELKIMCRERTEQALQIAIDIMEDKKRQPKDRLKALEIILERGYGKAAQAIIGGDEGDKPVKLTVEGIVNLLKK